MSVLEGILFCGVCVSCVTSTVCEVTTMEIADRPGRESIVVIERASERDLKARPYMPPPIMIQM